jgi:tetratricopeptide (TPR) repeat protein
VILTGSMQRNGDRLRIIYSVFDASTQTASGDTIDGSFTDLFGAQDKLAESVADTLRLAGKYTALARASIPDDAGSQRQYLEALGYLAQDYDMASVDHAISLLESIEDRKSASIVAALGRAYLVKYQLTHDEAWATRAGAACEKAAEMDPQNPDVHYTLGELRRRTGRHTDAIAEYKRALAQQPNNASAVLGLATTYDAQGRLADAAAEYRHAIALQPNFWGGYLSLGAFHFAHGQWADAATQFQKVIELKPDHLRAYNNLGAVYQQLGRYDDAIRVFSDSLRRKPTPQAYSNLGTCYYSLGRYADAASAYESASRLVPTKYIYWLNLGDALRWLPDSKARAADAYNRAIARARADIGVDPKDYPAHAALANCLAKTSHGSEAKKEIAIALQADPTKTSYAYQAAIVANARGDAKETAAHLRKAIELGYNAGDLQRDPEFANLRKSDIFQQILQQTTSVSK